MAHRSILVVAMFLIAAALSPAAAHAYLDPGTGSLLLQALVAGLLAAVMTVRIYFQRLKSFVRRLFGRKP